MKSASGIALLVVMQLGALVPASLALEPASSATPAPQTKPTKAISETANNPAEQNPQKTILKGGVSHNVSPIKEDGSTETINQGTPVNLTISANLNSELTREGEDVIAMVSADLKDGNKVLLPGQWYVHGKVAHVEKQRRLGRNGSIDIKFDKLISPDGKYQIPFEASASTNESAIKSGLKHAAKDASYVSIGAFGGALASVQLTGIPLAVATNGYSVAAGAAVGATLGAIAAARRKGKMICTFPGDELRLRITKPLILPAFNPEALPSAAPLAHLDNFDIRITNWKFNADPYGDKLSRLLTVNFRLENRTAQKYRLCDIALISERNKLYRPYATRNDMVEMQKSVAPHATQEATLSFGVDNPHYKYRLVLLDRGNSNILTELPIN